MNTKNLSAAFAAAVGIGIGLAIGNAIGFTDMQAGHMMLAASLAGVCHYLGSVSGDESGQEWRRRSDHSRCCLR